jgi:hypothetical protein
MITRRGFLGSLLGIAAAPVILRVPLVVAAPNLVVIKRPIILPTLFTSGRLVRIDAQGSGEESALGWARVVRYQGHPIWMGHVNVYGGIMCQEFPHDQEVLFTEQFPLVVDVSPLVRVHLSYWDEQSEKYRVKTIEGVQHDTRCFQL